MSLRRWATGAILCGVATSVCAAETPVENLQVDRVVCEQAGFWSQSTNAFMRTYGTRGFRWTSDARDTARAYRSPIRFLEWPVVEALAEFGGGRLARLTLVLYSRGDVGGLTFDAYRETVARLDAALNAWTETKAPTEMKQPALARGVRLQSFAWVKGTNQFVAEWSHSELSPSVHQPEFIRLRIEPFDPARDPRSAVATATAAMSAARKGTVTLSELRQRVAHEPHGDVLIPTVPMVDQGPKGYCAVATTERVLTYYGLETDQHVMAQLAQSSAAGGTSLEAMLAALNAVGPKIGCRVREHIALDYKSLQVLSKRYDREAHKAGKPPAVWTTPIVDMNRLFESMDKTVLLTVRAEDADARKLPVIIKEYVDKGMPLTWGVQMGLVDETPAVRQTGGGHLRLIIGYNSQTREVLYTDTWGRGHELKRLPFDKAWAMTLTLHSVEPRFLTQ